MSSFHTQLECSCFLETFKSIVKLFRGSIQLVHLHGFAGLRNDPLACLPLTLAALILICLFLVRDFLFLSLEYNFLSFHIVEDLVSLNRLTQWHDLISHEPGFCQCKHQHNHVQSNTYPSKCCFLFNNSSA